MMYGSLRCFATLALLGHSAFSEFAKANSCMLRVRWVKSPFASDRQACLGFRAFDPYIIYKKPALSYTGFVFLLSACD